MVEAVNTFCGMALALTDGDYTDNLSQRLCSWLGLGHWLILSFVNEGAKQWLSLLDIKGAFSRNINFRLK